MKHVSDNHKAFQRDGITFEIRDQDIAVMEDTAANSRNFNSHRIRLDIAVYKRLLEACMAEQARLFVIDENFNDKIKPGMDRMVDVVVKSFQGRVESLVAAELERVVREKVLAMVVALPITVKVDVGLVGKEATNGEVAPE